MTELLQCHDKASTDEMLLLTDEQRRWFLERESIPGEDTAKTIATTTEDLEYHMNLVDEAFAGVRGPTLILKEVLRWVKCYRPAAHATETQL